MSDDGHDPHAQALRRVTGTAHLYARRSDYHLFPDETVVRTVLEMMADNLVAHGRAYCPCREVTGDAQRDRQNICPCKSHHDDIARDGHCECRLFVNDQFIASRKPDKSTEEGN